MFCKKGVLKNLAKFTGKTFEFWEIFKNTFFYRTRLVAASPFSPTPSFLEKTFNPHPYCRIRECQLPPHQLPFLMMVMRGEVFELYV